MFIVLQLDDSNKTNESLKNENELLEKENNTLRSEKDASLLAEKKKQDQLNLVNIINTCTHACMSNS